MRKTYDVAVIGAGVFGAWSAYTLAQQGKRVLLMDAYGPGNSRASSGGETRIIRMNYGASERYTRMSAQSLRLWKRFCRDTGHALFHQTGALFTAPKGHSHIDDAARVLAACGVKTEAFDSAAAIRDRFPLFALDNETAGLYEPISGILLARRGVAAVVAEAQRLGVTYRQQQAAWPLDVPAGQYVFACGPWLPKVFPDLLQGRIRPTRQHEFYLAFHEPMPAWIDFAEGVYTVPNIEHRGFKIGIDTHGALVDPDTQSRVPDPAKIKEMRAIIARRLPSLAAAPIVETRICQYENTSNGDFLIDRHPEHPHVLLVGGGSGHGFKHGPAVGAHVAAIVNGGHTDPAFSLASKSKIAARKVF